MRAKTSNNIRKSVSREYYSRIKVKELKFTDDGSFLQVPNSVQLVYRYEVIFRVFEKFSPMDFIVSMDSRIDSFEWTLS